MTNYKQLHQHFERQKNIKAFGITVFIMAGLFLVLFLVSWTIPAPHPPAVDEGIEVNLGNSDQGFGDIPPQIPGELSAEPETAVNAPATTLAAAETNPEVADNNEPDAPVIKTAAKPEIKPNAKAKENTTATKPTNKPVVVTEPKQAKPKAVYAGGKNPNTGGNNADSYNNATNQGIAGGKGDQGKPNGNPNSDSYTGNGGTGNGGINIVSGLEGRKISSSARFEDTYKYGGKVVVNITVDENGNVISQSLKQPSPFPDINKIALKRASQLKFSKGAETQSGSVVIKFESPKG
jgi:TonB family protein